VVVLQVRGEESGQAADAVCRLLHLAAYVLDPGLGAAGCAPGIRGDAERERVVDSSVEEDLSEFGFCCGSAGSK
jgi:hypothetical protein